MKKNIVFLLLFLAAFAYGQEALDKTTVEKIVIIQKESEKKTQGSLSLNTGISGVDVYLNGLDIGKTPLINIQLAPGIYQIVLRKQGYHDRELLLEIREGVSKELYVQMQEALGFLKISVNIPDATIYLNNQSQKPGLKNGEAFLELTEGEYQLEVSRFGYTAHQETLTIKANRLCTVTARLEKQSLAISRLQAKPAIFNPENPGELGKTRISFLVTAPGQAEIQIKDTAGQVVHSKSLANFSTWEQSFLWDGKRSDGLPAPNGTYTIEIHGIEKNEPVNNEVFVYTNCRIDNSEIFPFLDITAAGTGIGQVSSSRLLPSSKITSGISVDANFAPLTSGFISAPVFMYVTASPLPWLELTANAGFISAKASQLPLNVGGTVKLGAKKGMFSYAGYLGYAWQAKNMALTTPLAGLRFGFSGGITFVPCYLDYNTEYLMAPEQGIFTPFESLWKNGLSLRIQKKSVASSVWLSYASKFAAAQIRWFESFTGGLDFLFLIPHTTILLNTGISSGFSPERWFIGGRLGVVIIY